MIPSVGNELLQDPFIYISTFLKPTDLVNMTKVCNVWNLLLKHPDIWAYQSAKKFPFYAKLPTLNWNQHFQSHYNSLFYGSLNFHLSLVYTTNKRTLTHTDIDEKRPKHIFIAHKNPINQIYIYDRSLYTTQFLCGFSDGVLKIWDTRIENVSLTENMICKQVHENKINCIEIQDDILYTGSEDGSIKTWKFLRNNPYEKIQDIEMIIRLNSQEKPITCLQISKEDHFTHRVFASSRDGIITVWDITKNSNSEQKLIQSFKAHQSTITVLKISSRTKCLISGSIDKTIKIWNRNSNGTYICKQTLNYHTATITCLLADPIDDYFYSGSLDGKIITYQLDNKTFEWKKFATNETTFRIIALKFHQSSEITKDRTSICSLSTDGVIVLWKKTKDGLNPILVLNNFT